MKDEPKPASLVSSLILHPSSFIPHPSKMMTPERWQQVDDLLQAALEQPAAARAEFLQQACAGDTGLLKEVESLLSFQAADDEFLAAPPAAIAAEMLEQGTAQLLLGRKLGRYELQSALGRGGMGAVYLAQDTQLGRQVALKLLPRRFTSDPERVRRFRQEARAISALNHPNILTIHEIGEASLTEMGTEKGAEGLTEEGAEGGIHFLATEYVAGQTLRARLLSGELTLGEALNVALQTASALSAAHQAGIIHRDIKPENIMLRPDGLIKVLDFGLAKLTGTQPKTAAAATFSTIHTNPGIVMGTVSYMSPEQARGLEVDERSDIFSLGVVLYEMLTGRAPFAGATTGDVLVSILDREPKPLASLAPAVPAALQRIVSRALAKDTTARYQHAVELHDELKELKQRLELAARLKRSGETPAGEVSLSLRVGQSAGAEQDAAERPTSLTTQMGAWPADKSRPLLMRLLQPLRHSGKRLAWVAVALVLALAIAVLGWRQGRGFGWLKPRGETLNTIAVLPFSNALNDPQMDYLSDGITESLMQSLQQVPALRVMARGAVFAYKGREVDPRQVGQALQARAVVTGRLQRQGEQLLISVELVDARDGTLLWSERYPRPLAEVQAVQTEIVHELTSKLRLQLSGAQQQRLAARYTQNGEAYQLYLLGRYHWNKRTADGMLKSVEYFRQASEQDPAFALAYVGLADAYNTLVAYRVKPPREVEAPARAAIERALQIDEQLADAHASLGKLLTDTSWEWDRAEAQFKRAFELNPNYANAHHWYSSLLGALGRFDEAVREARLADELDAHAPATHIQLGSILYRARRYDEALAVLRETLAQQPNNVTALCYAGFCYMVQGRYAEALAELYKARAAAPRSPDVISILGLVSGLAGQRAEALRYQAELKALARQTYVAPSHYSGIAAGLGDWDRYFALMDKCVEEGLPAIRGLKTDPIYDVVRGDPRFAVLLRHAGFPP